MVKKVIIAGTLIAVLGALYYTVSPLFRNVVVEDEAPVPAVSSSTQSEVPERAPIEPVPVIGTSGHPASGDVRVVETDAGHVVRYENYKTINGPDLFVYLSKDLEAKEFVNLGELRGTEGSINYEVPEGVDLGEYRYVLTWCKQFGVLFNYADVGSEVGTVPTNEETMMSEKTETVAIGDGAVNVEAPSVPVADAPAEERTALLANGCFWCVEHDLAKVPGVTDVVSGYAGGRTDSPTYKNYADGGHREVVLVTYDPSKVTYGNLVEHILKHGDPTDPDGSFGDRGPEYAPALYYESDAEKKEAERVVEAVDALSVFGEPLPIAILPRVQFWPAEEYHQDYSEKNPIRYSVYRRASGRDAFIEKYWGVRSNLFEVPAVSSGNETASMTKYPWESFVKPSDTEIRSKVSALAYEVTQEEGTERAGTSPYDKLYEDGIYVDILSGEPLFSSKDKYDSGTGWPSFVRPIADGAVTLHEDKGLFTTRTEVRSRYADAHLGHVFDDGPDDRGGKRYCMNGVALRFVPRADMEREGYGHLLSTT